MDKVKSWTIIYDDGTTFTDEDGAPEDAPVDGVQWIVENVGNGNKRYVHGLDHYRWTGDSWAGGNQADLERLLRKIMPELKFGRWTSDNNYAAIAEMARKLYDR